jgi:hypothetical protein
MDEFSIDPGEPIIDLAEQIDVLFIGVPDPRHLGAVYAFADWGGRRSLEECLPFPSGSDNWWPIPPDRWRSLAHGFLPQPPRDWLATCLDVRNSFGADTFAKMDQHPDAYASFLVLNLRSLRSAFYSPEDGKVHMGEVALGRQRPMRARKVKSPSGGTHIIFEEGKAE